jgi:hypothetical protein
MSALSGLTPTVLEARPPFPANRVGVRHASAQTGIAVEEYGQGALRQTVIRFTNVAVTMTRTSANINTATANLYTIGAASVAAGGVRFKVDGVVTNLTLSTTQATDASMVSSVGTAAAATDNATLTGTEADLIASATTAVASSAATMNRVGAAAQVNAALFDATGGAVSIFLNFASATDLTTGHTLTLNGTVTLTWHVQGPVL